MPKRLRIRTLNEEEERVIEKLFRSRTASVRLVQRASIIRLSHQGYLIPQIAQ